MSSLSEQLSWERVSRVALLALLNFFFHIAVMHRFHPVNVRKMCHLTWSFTHAHLLLLWFPDREDPSNLFAWVPTNLLLLLYSSLCATFSPVFAKMIHDRRGLGRAQFVVQNLFSLLAFNLLEKQLYRWGLLDIRFLNQCIILVLIGDGFSGWIGFNFGRTRLRSNRSLEGFLGFLVGEAIALSFFPFAPWSWPLAVALAALPVLELFSLTDNDEPILFGFSLLASVLVKVLPS